MLRTIPRKERARNIIVNNLHYLAEKSACCKCRTCPHGIGMEECKKCDEWWWERARLFISDTVIHRLRQAKVLLSFKTPPFSDKMLDLSDG